MRFDALGLFAIAASFSGLSTAPQSNITEGEPPVDWLLIWMSGLAAGVGCTLILQGKVKLF
jgi:hypothetical protein